MANLRRIGVLAAALVATASAQMRVRLTPSSIRSMAEPDFETWTIESETQNASTTIGDVQFSIAAPDDSYLEGTYYKYQYTRFVSSLGERVVNQGVTTSSDNPGAITLTIQGLAEGQHTLLTYHNVWDNLESTGSVSVAVDGEEQATVRLLFGSRAVRH